MATTQRSAAPRRPTNVSLPVDTVAAAKDLGINVSQACEQGLAAAVKKAQEERWVSENWEAIQSSNAWVEKNGLPFTKYRML